MLLETIAAFGGICTGHFGSRKKLFRLFNTICPILPCTRIHVTLGSHLLGMPKGGPSPPVHVPDGATGPLVRGYHNCPISATICSVLEAGWKPRTPGLWQAPDASATLDGAVFSKAQRHQELYRRCCYRKCDGGVDVVGVVTPLVRGGAQVLHGDQVVELSVLLEVHEKEEVEEDGEGQIEVESDRGELKERRTCTWMT